MLPAVLVDDILELRWLYEHFALVWFPNMTYTEFQMTIYWIFVGIFALVFLSWIIQAVGYAKLYAMNDKYKMIFFVPFIPIVSYFGFTYFLACELFDDSIQYARRRDDLESAKRYRIGKIFLILYPAASLFIPVIGQFVSFGGFVYMAICLFRYMYKKHAPGWHYVIVTLFPIFTPFVWCSYYKKKNTTTDNVINVDDIVPVVKKDFGPKVQKSKSDDYTVNDSEFDYFDSQF